MAHSGLLRSRSTQAAQAKANCSPFLVLPQCCHMSMWGHITFAPAHILQFPSCATQKHSQREPERLAARERGTVWPRTGTHTQRSLFALLLTAFTMAVKVATCYSWAELKEGDKHEKQIQTWPSVFCLQHVSLFLSLPFLCSADSA